MAGRLIRQGWMQKFDKSTMPNATNLLPQLQNVDFDPGRNYSLTWQTGFGGLAWNKEKVPGGLKNVRTSGSPSSRAASRCSRRCATRWA